MLVLKRGQGSGTSNPVVLYVYVEGSFADGVIDPGFIADVDELTYRVLDPDGLEVTPTTAVDVVADKIRTGTYAPPINIGGTDKVGTWSVEWTAIRTTGVTDPVTATSYFRVIVADEPVPNGYALLSDMRAQGVPDGICDADVVAAVERASRLIERWTRRFFEPRYMVRQHDGKGQGIMVRLADPIIGVEDMEITFSDFRPVARLISREQVRVYNRHMRGLLQPDDRNSPKIEIQKVEDPLFQTPRFPALNRRFTPSQLNVQLTGWFGYTEPDGSPLGCTPPEITRVTMMLAMRDVRPLWGDFKAGRRGTVAGTIQSERTRDQSVTYSSGGARSMGALAPGYFSGDPLIDQVIARYVGPMLMVSV